MEAFRACDSRCIWHGARAVEEQIKGVKVMQAGLRRQSRGGIMVEVLMVKKMWFLGRCFCSFFSGSLCPFGKV